MAYKSTGMKLPELESSKRLRESQEGGPGSGPHGTGGSKVPQHMKVGRAGGKSKEHKEQAQEHTRAAQQHDSDAMEHEDHGRYDEAQKHSDAADAHHDAAGAHKAAAKDPTNSKVVKAAWSATSKADKASVNADDES